jgi:two-component system, chemotaxis family, chemotaxis protein CheY
VSRIALVVDDAVVMRRLVRRPLEQAGFEVVEATNGQEALDALRSIPACLVVTDWNMPVMGGIDLIRSIRRHPQHQFVPVVLLTSDPDPAQILEARAAGVTCWVNKPIAPAQLVALALRLCRAA